MIPATNSLDLIDELPGETYDFGIGDPTWVMRTQAKLYSDVTTAIIREYSTNAYDANIMAGNPAPIKVTLPSTMNTFFTVEDKGVGMDLKELTKTYIMFGISDKRENADTNGLMGYGSKSGLAYCQRFEVHSVKDGIRRECVVYRTPEWKMKLKVVDTRATTEGNGTKIIIPVHNVEEFNHKAQEFYKFWLPGRVLVNGKKPEHAVGKKISENLYECHQWNTSYVVLGNVAYRINNPSALFWNTKMNQINFVAYVDSMEMEDGGQPVDFTPAREDLEYSDRTKSTLQRVINDFVVQIEAEAQSEIDNAANHREAFAAWSKWRSTLGSQMFGNLEFKGEKFKSEFDIAAMKYNTNSYRGSTYRVNKWHIENMGKTMVVTEFTPSLSSDHKRKARDYAALRGWNINEILFTAQPNKEIQSVWLDKSQFINWEDLKAALPKKPRKAPATGTGGRIPGSFDFITKSGKEYEKELPKSTKDVYWIDLRMSKRVMVKSILRHLDSDATVVILPKNRQPKFQRENPKVKEFYKWAQSQVVLDAATLLSDDAKAVLAVDYSDRQWLSRIDTTKVDDPTWAHLKSVIENEDSLLKRYRANTDLARMTSMGYNLKQYTGTKTFDLHKTYPLLAQLSHYNINDHVYLYLNAAYAAETENNQ